MSTGKTTKRTTTPGVGFGRKLSILSFPHRPLVVTEELWIIDGTMVPALPPTSQDLVKWGRLFASSRKKISLGPEIPRE
jgi:hypothetical protein